MSGESVVESLQHVALFAGLDPVTLASIAGAVDRVRVTAGTALITQGDPGDSLFIVLRGRFVVERVGDEGGARQLSEIGTGDLIGEMAMLSSEPRAATVRATRTSEVARLTREAFDLLTTKHPELMRRLATLLAERLRRANVPRRAKERLRTVALLPHDPSVRLEDFARELQRALLMYGASELVTSAVAPPDDMAVDQREERTLATIASLDRTGCVLLLLGDGGDARWNEIVLGQADLILVVARATSDPAPGAAEAAISPRLLAKRELVLVCDLGADPVGTARWIEGRRFARHHHLRRGDAAHTHRLARRLAGRSIGVVFGGGGARGFAHIGVVRALAELGVPVDRVGGTSMGSIMAAEVALGWDSQTMHERTRYAFRRDPLAWDNTLPLVSKIACNKVARLFQGLLGDARAEDCWLPYFSVACNLTRATVTTHDTGLLWRCVRASSALPGLGPPVIQSGEFLVDGAILDNLPAQKLADEGIGPVIAINVSPEEDLGTPWPDNYSLSGWRLLWERVRGTPGAREYPSALWVLQRSVLLGSIGAAARMKDVASLYMHVPVGAFDMFKWSEIDPIVEVGYATSRAEIQTWATASGVVGA